MSEVITFFAYGEPKGQPRPRAAIRNSRNGHPHLGFFAAGTADSWKNAVKHAAQDAGFSNSVRTGPIELTLRFRFPRPSAHHTAGDRSKPQKAGAPVFHTTKPDADNAAKAVMDALTDIGAWRDDTQVCILRVEKLYADDHIGCEITISSPAD